MKGCSSWAKRKKRQASSARRSDAMPAGRTPGSSARRCRSITITCTSWTGFGPLFIKFCTYFPYAVKVCLNGHEWLKRQLTRRGVAYEPLDNGIRSTEDAARVQAIAHQLDAAKIEAVVRKWLRRLPHPFTAAHRAAGYRYQLSILQ